jgi:hypothetical protein
MQLTFYAQYIFVYYCHTNPTVFKVTVIQEKVVNTLHVGRVAQSV